MEIAEKQGNIPINNSLLGKAEKKSGKRIGFNYVIIKSLKESKKNDVVKCLYIKGITKFGLCVIKEGSSGDSKDKEGRDIIDRLIWQKHLHQVLQSKIRIPKLIDSFEENGNFYLVIQYIKGKSLYSILRRYHSILRTCQTGQKNIEKRIIHYLIQITSLLELLHKNNYVHRDVTPANFMITPYNKVYIIDMELSYCLDDTLSPPFQLGTQGYMSPQQNTQLHPSVKDDIFSLGAIILQALSGIHPQKIINGNQTSLVQRISFLTGTNQINELLLRCLSVVPKERPTTAEIKQALIKHKRSLGKNKRMTITPLYDMRDIRNVIHDSIITLSTPLYTDDLRGWFSEDLNLDEEAIKNRINKAWYASFRIGAAGILYLLSQAKKIGINTDCCQTAIKNGLNLIQEKYIKRTNAIKPGLFNGAAGIALSLTASVKCNLIDLNENLIDWIKILLDIDNNILNLESGLAGQGHAYIFCKDFLEADTAKYQTRQFAGKIIDGQLADGSWTKGGEKNEKKSCTLEKGAAGILNFLLDYMNFTGDQDALRSIQRGLKWLIKKSIRKDKFIIWPSSFNKKLDYGLLNGNAGIALTFLKAYKLIGDPTYKAIAKSALTYYAPHITHDNLSLDSGISGLGEVYLEAFSILQEDEWLERADWIAQLLIHLKKEHSNYGPYWIAEKEKEPVANLMRGTSGIIHFLLRYAYMGKGISFPLLSS